jgi:hypothetical protein
MKYLGKIEGAEVSKDHEHANDEGKISDPIDNKGFLGRVPGAFLVDIIADQQIRAEANPFPPHKHQQIVVGQNKRQHHEHKEVHVSKEAIETFFLFLHIADGVNMDEKAHSCHHEDHDSREWIQLKSPGDIEVGQLTGGRIYRWTGDPAENLNLQEAVVGIEL